MNGVIVKDFEGWFPVWSEHVLSCAVSLIHRPARQRHSVHGLPDTGCVGLRAVLVDLWSLQLLPCCGGTDYHGGGVGPEEAGVEVVQKV